VNRGFTHAPADSRFQAGAVRDLLASRDWQSLTTYRDPAGHERVVHARR
jgi:hypothetical protein